MPTNYKLAIQVDPEQIRRTIDAVEKEHISWAGIFSLLKQVRRITHLYG
jgi:hypothetical protein